MKHRAALVFLVLSFCFCLNACSTQQRNDTQDTADTITKTTDDKITEEITAPNVYPYTVTLENGHTKTVSLHGADPQLYAQLYLAQLDDTGTLNRVILYRPTGDHQDADAIREEVYVFDGMTGESIPVTPVEDVLKQFLTVDSMESAWVLHIGGAEYHINKTQFPPEQSLLEIPCFDKDQNFSINNNQLFCTVGILCAENPLDGTTSYARETLLIRYGYDVQTREMVPVELTFQKSETTISGPPIITSQTDAASITP